MCRIGIAGEDVIGQEVGSSPGISHSPPVAIMISFTVAGFRPLPSEVCIYIHIYIYVSIQILFRSLPLGTVLTNKGSRSGRSVSLKAGQSSQLRYPSANFW